MADNYKSRWAGYGAAEATPTLNMSDTAGGHAQQYEQYYLLALAKCKP